MSDPVGAFHQRYGFNPSISTLETAAGEYGYEIETTYLAQGGEGTVRLINKKGQRFTGATMPGHPKGTLDAYADALEQAVRSMWIYENRFELSR